MNPPEITALCLSTLSTGSPAALHLPAGWHLVVVASNADAVSTILRFPGEKILLLADERDLLRHVAALDLSMTDTMEAAHDRTAFRLEGILGVDERLLAPDGSMPVFLSRDETSFEWLKRLRMPLAMVRVPASQAVDYPGYVSTWPDGPGWLFV
ncbi:MAG: hypothetical protein LCH51_01865 [Bacteroidetes bacterium]|nr:hypothetical protein [Bacteroidota bacterium]HOA37807.1 hypothetical protein [Flavihumibacter sp.]